MIHSILLIISILASLGASVSLASISYKLELDLNSHGENGVVTGVIHSKGGFGSGPVCFFLPLNDSDYHVDLARGMSPTVMKFGRNRRESGKIDVEGGGQFLGEDRQLYRLESFPVGASLRFEGRLPRWSDAKNSNWFFNDYYPTPLKSCPGEKTSPMDYQRVLDSRISVEIASASGWATVHPGVVQKGSSEILFVGSKFSFSYSSDVNLKSIRVNDTEIVFAYKSTGFEEIVEVAESLFRSSLEIFGPYPFSKLVVLETEDLEKSLVPGIVTINREKQRAINATGKKPLNWHLWQLANFLPQQWLGVVMHPETMDDFWFHKGLSDVGAYLLLKKIGEAFDFFDHSPNAPFVFSFDYRQAQDLVAGVLTFLHPFNALTDDKGRTIESIEEQHSFGYVRHSLAMRYLYWRYAGQYPQNTS